MTNSKKNTRTKKRVTLEDVGYILWVAYIVGIIALLFIEVAYFSNDKF